MSNEEKIIETEVKKDQNLNQNEKKSANELTNKKPIRNFDRKDNKRSPRRERTFKRPQENSDFTEKVIWIRRINKVTTGGRRLRFSAAVLVGNKKGSVGIGISKANEVSDAIKKAVAAAHKNLKTIAINENFSIYHSGVGQYCSSKILLKPAKEGIGVKAGGAAREVMEVAGIQNIYSKSLGSNNKINLARATIDGLASLKSADHFKNRAFRKKVSETVEEKK